MLDWLKYNAKVKSYIWKAEVQSNGNIHFHITTNQFVHYLKIRNAWNSILSRHGYLHRYVNDHGSNDAPSTEIRSVKNSKSVVQYLAAYVSKKDLYKNHCTLSNAYPQAPAYSGLVDWITDNNGLVWELKRKLSCRVWGCSYNLTANFLSFTSEHEAMYNSLKLLKRSDFYKFIRHDYGMVMLMNLNTPRKFKGALASEWRLELAKVMDGDSQLKKIITTL